MDAYDVIKQAAAARGLALADVCRTLGKRDNYIANMRGRSIGIDNYASIMQACGYALCAMPLEAVPAGALVVDPGERQRDNASTLAALADGVQRGRAMRQQLEAGTVSEAVAVASMSSDPGKRGRFKPVASSGLKDQTASDL